VIHLWDVLTGQERRQFAGHQSGGDERGTFAAGVAVLTFTPDGHTLISGGGDTTILLWDVYGSARQAHTQALAERWRDLSADATKAHEAVGALIGVRGEAVSFLKDKLHAIQPCDAQRLARLISDLDSDDFDVRERAARELEQLRETAAAGMRKALDADPSAETRRRLVDLLQKLDNPPTGEALASLRGVEVLEMIGTPEAVDVLRGLAKGAPEARLTKAAKSAVARLTADR
jgi:hypothetical protein